MEALGSLWDAFAAALIPLMPVLAPAVVGAIVAACRHFSLVRTVRSAAIRAEAGHGEGNGETKDERAKAKKKSAMSSAKNTLFGRTISTPKLDKLLETHGVPAANQYRISLTPPEPKR